MYPLLLLFLEKHAYQCGFFLLSTHVEKSPKDEASLSIHCEGTHWLG